MSLKECESWIYQNQMKSKKNANRIFTKHTFHVVYIHHPNVVDFEHGF